MSTKKFDYRVRVQVALDSPDGVLLDCIKNERHQSYSHKEMLLWALRAYWMPIAYQLRREQGELSISDAQMRRIAQDAIHQLKQQISYLQSTFEVGQDYPTEGAITAPASQTARSLVAITGIPEATTTIPSSPTSETVSASDGEWYDSDDLFDSQVQ
ncbi:hypothetical protein ACKFKF_15075 [Phormidesmis sp. 146-12]